MPTTPIITYISTDRDLSRFSTTSLKILWSTTKISSTYNQRLYITFCYHQNKQNSKFLWATKSLSKNRISPLRRIINSLLSSSAKIIDHMLQPLARAYSYHLHNSNQLLQIFTTMYITQDVLLISMDIISLFPWIPKTECLNIIYEEMSY
jgi:hypothetical protein